MKYGLSSDKRDFYRSNKWSSDAGLGLQRAWTGFFGHLCPEVPQVCWGGAGVRLTIFYKAMPMHY